MEDRWTALVTHALSAGLTVRCTATGQSMEPAVRDGETIVVEPVNTNDLATGMVILARAGGRELAHRVVQVERDAAGAVIGVRTRGDAVAGDDPPVLPADVRGRVVAVARDGRDVTVPLVPASPGRLMEWIVAAAVLGLLIMALTWARTR